MTTDQVPAGAAQAVPADPARQLRAALRLVRRRARRMAREWEADRALLRDLVAGLDKLVDELDTEATSYAAAREHLAASDHQAAVSAHVRWQMATDAAARLRALLEET